MENIRLRELKIVDFDGVQNVKISYYVTMGSENVYDEILVDFFDIENTSLEDVIQIVKDNMDRTRVENLVKNRMTQKASTYRHDGTSFKAEVTDVEWSEGIAYSIDDVVTYNDKLYRCVQSHTSQAGWNPEDTASLWSSLLVFADEFSEWKQPQGAHDAYPIGSIVIHNGQEWIAIVDNNVWEPTETSNEWELYTEGEGGGEPEPEGTPQWEAGVSYVIDDVVEYNSVEYSCIQAHTSQVGWEPPNVPALWDAV